MNNFNKELINVECHNDEIHNKMPNMHVPIATMYFPYDFKQS